jgi:hypothetical protein
MKSAIIFTGTGPILILTTYDSLTHPVFVKKLAAKGINKFIAIELPVEDVKTRYGENLISLWKIFINRRFTCSRLQWSQHF